MHAVTKSFKLLGNKWGVSQAQGTGGGIVSYSFATQNFQDQFAAFGAFITEDGAKNDITASFASWESAANIRFVELPDSIDVDIRLGWGDFDGNGGVLGETTIPSSGPLDDVLVLLDVAEEWFFEGIAPPGRIDFSTTVTHEIGHAIGIDHSENNFALMHPFYSETTLELKQDDVDAVENIYGQNPETKIEVFRFFNPDLGGHFFTANALENRVVGDSGVFNTEGVGFIALAEIDHLSNGSTPVYRFLNTSLNSHFFTAFEIEKEHLLTKETFILEGVAFYAYSSDSASTLPIHRFFDTEKGGHFFTASEIERDLVMNLAQFRYEGEAFYAFADLHV